MTASRRDFLIGTGSALAASALAFGHPSRLFANPLGKPIGLQLYTVREQLEKDYDGTLRLVAAIGYREVETAGFFGKKPAEIKKSLQAAGLHCGSVHMGMGGLEEALPYATELGAKYVISSVTLPKPTNPSKFDVKAFMAQLAALTLDDYKSMAQRCNELGEQAKKAGLQFGYHNHNLEFRKIGDVVPYDLLLKETDPALVGMEMDIGWVVAGGADPVAYLTKYPSRYISVHIKDLKNEGIPNTNMKMTSAIIGKGIIDWSKVLPAIKKSSVRSAYLELEEPYDPSPLGMVQASAEYLKGKI